MNYVLLINHKLLTIANSWFLNIAELDIFFANKYENAFSYLLAEKISYSAEKSMEKVLQPRGQFVSDSLAFTHL